jgi:O-antigen ligase
MADQNGIVRGVEKAGRWSVIALGFSIPISVALDNVLLAVVLLCYLSSGRHREKLAAIAANPVSMAALALFGVLTLAISYGPATPGDATRYLLKYADLLCIPAIAAFFADSRARRLGLHAFGAAVAITLLISFARVAGLLPDTAPLAMDPPYPVVFKRSLTHAVLVVFGALLFSLLALYSDSRRARFAWLALAAFATANVLFLVPGRTAYVILMALLLYAGFAWLRWKGLLSMIVVAVIVTAVTFGMSAWFQERVRLAVHEYSASDPSVAAKETSSIGLRLEFYRNSLEIVRDHPIAGVGTGGFPRAYADQVKGTGMSLTPNPHNEYLLIAVQTGLAGLALLLYLFVRQFTLAQRLASPLETHLACGLVITMAVGCLFNSFLLDHTEGVFYAWFTGLLYGGLQSRQPGRRAPAAPGFT